MSGPNVPSIAEAGVTGYEAELWFGVIAPAGTPDAIVDRLNKEIARFIKSDFMQKRLASQGARAIGIIARRSSPPSCAPSRTSGARC